MTATRLSPVQEATLRAAVRAKYEPMPSIGWVEHVVLREAGERTLFAIERKGLVESYFDRSEKISWRLTQAGEDAVK
jgi:hypothetical protein